VASRYDIESLLRDIATFIAANLPAKLTAITTEKGDSLTLEAPASGAYFLQNLEKEAANYDPILVYGIEDIEPGGGTGPGTALPLKLFVMLALHDVGNDPNVVYRLLRYQRALMDIFESNWASVGNSVKFRVSGLVPIPLSFLGPDREHLRNTKAVGLNLEATLS
jgi:hypothetical protein